MDDSTRLSKIKADFILLSEFAEIRHGPKPILTIPENAEGDFDISSFSVRVFSTDFQQSTDESFSMCADAHVLLTDHKDGAYAYVHYFALNDIQARGYIRQYCICYISNSVTKIIDNFESLKNAFSEVTKLYKCGNHRIFSKDLDRRFADIEFSQEAIKSLVPSTNEDNPVVEYNSRYDDIPENDDEVLKKDHAYISSIMRVLSKEMKKKENQIVYLELEKQHVIANQALMCYSTGNSKFYDPQNTVPDLPEQDVYKPQRIMSHITHRFTRQLRSLEELSEGTSLLANEALKNIHRIFSRSEIALNIENAELRFVSPVSSLLSAGRVPLANMLTHKQNTDCDHLLHTHTYSVTTLTASDDTNMIDTTLERYSYSVTDRGRIQSLDYSFVNEDNLSMTALYLETVPRQRGLSIIDPLASPPASEGLTANKRSQSGLSCYSENFRTPAGSPSIAHGDKEIEETSSTEEPDFKSVTSKEENDENGNRLSLPTNTGTTGTGTGTSTDTNTTTSLCLSVSGSSPIKNGENVREFFSTPVNGVMSFNHIALATPSFSAIKGHTQFPFISSTNLIENTSKHKPGHSLQECFKDIPELRDIIYSILIGLPFVIIAYPKDQKRVMAHIKALWLFVAGHSSECQVIPWQETPLSLRQLQNVKLLGLSSNCRLHNNIKKHIAYWDWTMNTLIAPKYNGTFLNPILNRTRDKRNPEVYLSKVLCVLSELSCKVFLYYHGFCTVSASQLRQFKPAMTPEVSAKKLFAIAPGKDKMAFLSNARIKDSDIDILEYWLEIIRRQQLNEWRVHCSLSQTQGSKNTLRLPMKYCTEKVCKPK